MNPSNEGELLKRPHVYVKRPDGSSGYEPTPIPKPNGMDEIPPVRPAKANSK